MSQVIFTNLICLNRPMRAIKSDGLVSPVPGRHAKLAPRLVRSHALQARTVVHR